MTRLSFLLVLMFDQAFGRTELPQMAGDLRARLTDACGVRSASIGAGAAGSSHDTTRTTARLRRKGSAESSAATLCASPRSSATSPGEERKTWIGWSGLC